MEKRKRNPKDDRFPIEFISPYSLEECVERLPPNIAFQLSLNAYEFRLKSNINDNRNQFINIYGYLQRDTETTTRVLGEASFSPILYILLAFGIPFLAIGFSSFFGNLVTSIFFIGLIQILFIYILYQDKKRLLHNIFEIFIPVAKVKKPHHHGIQRILFPSLSLNLSVNRSLKDCTICLRHLIFWPAICRIVSLDPQSCDFDVSGLFGYWAGTKASGRLTQIDPNITQIVCRVGLNVVGYWQAIFMILILGFMSNADRGWLAILPCAIVLFPLFSVIVGLLNTFSFRRLIKKTLTPLVP